MKTDKYEPKYFAYDQVQQYVTDSNTEEFDDLNLKNNQDHVRSLFSNFNPIRCIQCRNPLTHTAYKHELWEDDIDEDFGNHYNCEICGFWYETEENTSGLRHCRISIARVKTFNISDKDTPIDAILRHLKNNWKDSYYVYPRLFEHVVAPIMKEYLNADFVTTQSSRDGGFDLICFDSPKGKVLVEVKRYAEHRKISVNQVRALAGACVRENSNVGVFLTTSDYTHASKTEAKILNSTGQVYSIELDLVKFKDIVDYIKLPDPPSDKSRFIRTEDYWRSRFGEYLGRSYIVYPSRILDYKV